MAPFQSDSSLDPTRPPESPSILPPQLLKAFTQLLGGRVKVHPVPPTPGTTPGGPVFSTPPPPNKAGAAEAWVIRSHTETSRNPVQRLTGKHSPSFQSCTPHPPGEIAKPSSSPN